MKYFIFVFSLFICLSTLYSLNWEWVNLYPTGNCLNDVEFIDTLNGILVGDAGTIIKTTDGGSSWEDNSFDQRVNLNGLSWLDTNNCWTAGDGGLILYSSDGGMNWTVQCSGLGYCFNAVSFSDSLHGCAAGNQGVIYYTQDGGNNWLKADSVTHHDLHGVSLADSLHGWAVGDSGIILTTESGGMSWAPQNSGVTEKLNEVEFINDQVGWAVGRHATLLKTINGGTTWYQTNYPDNRDIRSLSVVDSLNLWVVQEWDNRHELHRSTDAGENWVWSGCRIIWDSYSIHFTNNNNGWIVGDFGTIYSITDQGANWEPKYTNLFGFYTLVDVFFLNDTLGWVLPDVLNVFKTTDGGESFDTFVTSTDYFIHVFFIDENIGCVAGYPNWPQDIFTTNMHSTDGGETWVEGEYTSSILDIYFLSKNLGWGITYTYIIKTSNLGVNWEIAFQPSFCPYSIHFANCSNGWVVGNGGNILATKDSGVTWTPQTSNTSNKLTSVFFLDINIGYACGYNGTVIKTTDGGGHWTVQTTNVTEILNNIAFLDQNTGWAVGVNGTIISTTDGGVTWIDEDPPTNQEFYSVAIAGSSYVWTVGYGGMMLRAPIESTGVEEEPVVGDLNADMFSVVQNGTVLRINYSVTSSGPVSINIYDLSGRNVANILNEQKEAGTYTLDYQPEFSSGSYFFTIQTQEGIQTKQTFYLK